MSLQEMLASPHGDVTLMGTRPDGDVLLGQLRVGDQYDELPLAQVLSIIGQAGPSLVPDVRSDPDHAVVRLLTADAEEKLWQKYYHVVDVRDGLPDLPNVDKRYLETVSKAERTKSKAAQLNVDPTTVRRWLVAYKMRGLRGLLHGNTDLLENVLLKIPNPVLQVLIDFVDRERTASKKDFTNEYALLLFELKRQGLAKGQGGNLDLNGDELPDAHVLLPERTCRKALSALRGNRKPAQDAKARQSRDKSPMPDGTRHRAFEWMQKVLIDSTPVDVDLRGPDGLFRPHAVFAVDVETRYLWVRVCPGAPTGEDMGLLLHDMINPQPYSSRPTKYHPLTAVPKRVALNSFPPREGDRHPSGIPGTLVMDHGREGENGHFIPLLAQLGVAIDWARSVTPTDKAGIESAIRTFAKKTQLLYGHKGNAVKNSPANYAAAGQRYMTFVTFARAMAHFSYWYGARPHEGLPHPLFADRYLTPSEAVHGSISAGTPIRIAANPNFGMQFMPARLLTPQTYGVEYKNIVYVPRGKTEFAKIWSQYVGAGTANKLVFHLNTRDPVRLFWNVPGTFEWVVLYAPGADPDAPIRPFNDESAMAFESFGGHRRHTSQEAAVSASELAEVFDAHTFDDLGESPLIGPTKQRTARVQRNPTVTGHDVLGDSLDDYRVTRDDIDSYEESWI